MNFILAGQFENDVLNWLDSYFKKSNIVIMTGGSGMYIDAVSVMTLTNFQK